MTRNSITASINVNYPNARPASPLPVCKQSFELDQRVEIYIRSKLCNYFLPKNPSLDPSFVSISIRPDVSESARGKLKRDRCAKKEGSPIIKIKERKMVAELRKVCSVFHPDVDAAKASLENVAGNMYESVCVPDLGDFLGYQSGGGGGHQVATPEHKSPATPASSATSNSSGPQNGGNQAGAPLQPPSASVSLPSRQYHNDGKSLSLSLFLFLSFRLSSVSPP